MNELMLKVDINDPLKLAEKAAEFIYNVKARLYATKLILDTSDRDFTGEVFKQDCVSYQVEDVYQLLIQYESVFNTAVDDLLSGRKQASVEVLPNNCDQAVLSAGNQHVIPSASFVNLEAGE